MSISVDIYKKTGNQNQGNAWKLIYRHIYTGCGKEHAGMHIHGIKDKSVNVLVYIWQRV